VARPSHLLTAGRLALVVHTLPAVSPLLATLVRVLSISLGQSTSDSLSNGSKEDR
jgi:hypothetical protein